MFYVAPNGDFSKIGDDEGTSAATPLWASLMAQVDTIFGDQGLPHLGFANDLLYIAGAIAPGSFNDITFGNNVTSYINGGRGRRSSTPTAIPSRSPATATSPGRATT